MNKRCQKKPRGYGYPAGLPQVQKGAVLAVSLLILLIMTIIGVSALQTTTLEERMAGNLLDQRMAFQTAEAALRVAEGQIESLVAYPTTAGYYSLAADDPYDEGDAWDTMSVLEIHEDPNNTPSDPNDDINAEYYIKNLGEFAPDTGSSVEVTTYGGSIAGSSVTVLTVTARGTGRYDESGGDEAPTQILLRSYYGKRF